MERGGGEGIVSIGSLVSFTNYVNVLQRDLAHSIYSLYMVISYLPQVFVITMLMHGAKTSEKKGRKKELQMCIFDRRKLNTSSPLVCFTVFDNPFTNNTTCLLFQAEMVLVWSWWNLKEKYRI